ncbi:hybrid sensor histidine kinase/response regulator [Salipiger abyssi]|uniref:hybrid sensor histidine kinase/response regulator n=1 Tax=Salipiger abyssi TaxID=1250539 RepID=UPI001F1CDA15|nr:ATP-binding protein [Salipiger abyssi]
MLGLALACFGLVLLLPLGAGRIALLAAGAAFATLAALVALGLLRRRRRAARDFAAIVRFSQDVPTPIFATDADETVIFANAAACDRFGEAEQRPLAAVLNASIASAEGVMHRLKLAARDSGTAREDVATHAGRFRLSLHLGFGARAIWRVDPRAGPGLSESSEAEEELPLLTLGRSGAVLYMNGRARAVLGRRVKRIEDVLEDPPLTPGAVHRFVTPDGHRGFRVRCADAGIGRQELVLQPLEPAGAAAPDTAGFDALPVPLLRLAADGTVLRANAVACRLLAVERTDGGSITDYMEGLGRSITDWLSEAAAGRGLHRSEFLRLTRADREIFVQVTLNRVFSNGHAELVAVLNDATELKTLEAQFVQSQKMQAIGQLAGGVAHDFNNLLTAISGHCDLLLLRHDQGDPDYGDLVQINQNANRAAALVGQLLAFSRKQTLRPEVLDLRDTLSDLTHLLNRLVGEKVQLTLSHDPVLPTIRGDRRQLEQVMMNLVVNARDAMPEGGEITIETERRTLLDPLKRDRALVEPGEYAAVKVIDRGAGIPQDKLQKVFEPFYTTKRTGEGTGLGLSTVYGIVKQTGGFIFVDSVIGQGSCFTLLFPAHDAPAELPPAQHREAPRKRAQQGNGVVLLVEDEAPVRAFAARALRLRGYTVIEAGTAEDALDTLADDMVRVDIFVTDVVMPGMDGPTWVRKALEARPGTRVVFVSGYAEDVFAEGEDEVPNSVFLPKPFSLNQLTETVQRQLH